MKILDFLEKHRGKWFSPVAISKGARTTQMGAYLQLRTLLKNKKIEREFRERCVFYRAPEVKA